MKFQNLWTKLFTSKSEKEAIALHVAGATVRHRNPFENLEVPRNEEDLSDEYIEKWVVPFYMTHLANADETTIKAFSEAAKEINIDIVKALLGDFNWRTRISGAFFAAINNYHELEDIIGKHLLKSEVCYAGSGYCLALATFATDKAKDYLITYLDYYLDRKDLWFDQSTTYCALEYLDKNATARLTTKLNSFIIDKTNWDLEKYRSSFIDCMTTLDKIRRVKSEI
ncbi:MULTISPECIES: DUF6000 family protein [Niastella]|uniref:Uncharacterized protein n=1 Tax=Niastella soli TaxID=2821487 RepID=A0ABS3YPZ1_9BACT|nr:DUF6000 family protein [Niastella soli]MBO9199525.1 hypothetical protein [Niastella soli]